MTDKVDETLIDEEVARSWCGGDPALVERLWRSFYQQFASTPEQLSPGEAQDLAHNLKNLAPYCGATRLGDTAQQLAPPAPPPTPRQISTLLRHLREVLQALKSWLAELDQPVYMVHDERREIAALDALIQLLQLHNFSALGAFDEWAAEFALDWPRETIDDIKQALQTFNFERAQHLLKAAYRARGRYPADI